MIRKKNVKCLLSLICLSSLIASCSEEYTYPDVKEESGRIVNVDGKEYTFEDMYKVFDGEKDSAVAYFNVAKRAIAQLVTPITESMRATVQRKMDDLTDGWKKTARENGSTYKEEMEKALENEKLSTLDELQAKYLADEQVSENTNSYDATSTNSANEIYVSSEELTKRYIDEQVPYHVSHILVKVTADNSESNAGLTAAKISEENANKLGDVVKNLIRSTKFSDTAYTFSDDEGSANNYGELAGSDSGVSMNKSTSYINEFKLGLYAYDAFVNTKTKNQTRKNGEENVSIQKDLRVPSAIDSSVVKDDIEQTKIAQGKVYGIPLSTALSLKLVASQTKSDNGETVVYNANGDKASENSYPRNIIFNNYFNQHSVSFIYDDSEEYEANFVATLNDAYGNISSIADVQARYPDRYEEYSAVKEAMETMAANKFKVVDGASDNLITLQTTTLNKSTAQTDAWKANADVVPVAGSKKILCASEDSTKNDPIVVVRGGSGDGESGYQGIHFIVVNHSRFTPIDNDFYKNDVNNNYKYWRVNTPNPSQSSDPYTDDYSKYPSFINYVDANINASSSNNEYVSRTTWVKNAITTFDNNKEISTYNRNKENFRKMYNKDFDQLIGSNYAKIINDYIKVTLDDSKKKSEDTLDDSWETYINNLVSYQNVQPKRIVPTIAIPLFQQGNLTDIKESLNETK